MVILYVFEMWIFYIIGVFFDFNLLFLSGWDDKIFLGVVIWNIIILKIVCRRVFFYEFFVIG